ncbi:phage gp6-like head-tail connector protein [Mesorhizobium sp. M2D.F.Ca.ET.225.01.1.1]|uniref:head-tail connector protein n=1 Tax=unclassified Mesorhizobium TaxID=325217 RepID=UPI000FD46C48|nr:MULTISPECIES: head-tail connector protein [unclassified Mesorhizobium]TGP65446.1 phage gp6-like head-tail connector protein [Mesorhizobium sp. M2D.F.Ca.ET.226.01.1.1]TGP71925.1 phage gp6-like head-tail connector protein [Mesorhizobium sp. M2D.F.Ca.ET.225.01.1.1]
MALKLITDASGPLVTAAEIKRHIRAVDFSDDDDYLQALAGVAANHVDGPEPAWLGRSLAERQWQLILDGFPADKCSRIALPLPPLRSVDTVEYVDIDGTAQTIADFREFGVQSTNSTGFLLPAFGSTWPDTRSEPEAVKITFTAGFASVPPAVKHAILLLVGQWYENRENASEIALTEIPNGVSALLTPLKIWPS